MKISLQKRILRLLCSVTLLPLMLGTVACSGGDDVTVTTTSVSSDTVTTVTGENTTAETLTTTSGEPEEESPKTEMLADHYAWSNLPIGAGGFVTGLVIHPTEPDLVYIRTDVGGAYRWSETSENWTPLNDMFTRQQSDLYQIDGIALDAHNAKIVYIACGTGTQSTVMKSTDKGNTWTATGFNAAMRKKGNYPFDGNGTNRGSGERIAVDPANGNILYVGTGNSGLWRSEDAGETWTFVPLPGIGSGVEVRTVCFDPATSKEGQSTSTIYVGTIGKGVFRSDDGGDNWENLDGTPAKVNRMSIGQEDGVLYIAAGTGLFSLDGDTFTDISPMKGKEYGGVSVNPLADGELVCSIPQPAENAGIWFSEDGGESWTEKLAQSSISSSLPWLSSPTINSNGHCIVMDPNEDGRVWNTDWFCATRTENIKASSPRWTYLYEGIEEMCPRNLTCPPEGARVYVSVADNRGFIFTDIDDYPTKQLGEDPTNWWKYNDPGMMSISDTVFCMDDPKYMAVAGVNWNFYGKLELSKDGGKTWKIIKSIPSYVDDAGKPLLDSNGCNQQIQFGAIAMSAEKQENGYPAIIAVPTYEQSSSKKLPKGFENKPILVSLDWGDTWTPVTLPKSGEYVMQNHWHYNQPVVADTVAGNRFYIIGYRGQVYYSEDFGMTWKTGGSITDSYNYTQNEIKAAPGMEGEVFATMGKGLYRSSDGGKTFTAIKGVSETVGVGFGASAPGKSNPTVFCYGIINGEEGIFRSLDMGDTWERINPDNVHLGRQPNVVEGDMQEFGTVYLTSGGRGVFVGRDLSEKEN